MVGVFANNHQPQVLPSYFEARKKNPGEFMSHIVLTKNSCNVVISKMVSMSFVIEIATPITLEILC